MENAGVGWIAAIIIGGLAGWLAEKFMKSEMGLFMNIVLGIVGAALASAILRRRPKTTESRQVPRAFAWVREIPARA